MAISGCSQSGDDMIKTIFATLLIAAVTLLTAAAVLAQDRSPGLGGSGMTGGRGGYLGPQGAQPNNSTQPWAIDGREHVLMLGGAWGVPIKLICEKVDDVVGNVDGEVRCIGRDNKAYAPVFQRPVSGDGWVYCNPYDSSGYDSCANH